MAAMWRSAFKSSNLTFQNFISKSKKAANLPTRHLNLMEHQSKNLLDKHNVCIQKFMMAENIADATSIASDFHVKEYVIKAQILAGGRGLGHFDNGFKGGVHVTKDATQIAPIVEKMVGHKLITKQTPKEGIMVHKVMIAESVNIKRETYAASEIQKLWQLFLKVDALQLEINPLVETDDGQVVSVDAKLNFDDNAKFRQKEIFALEDASEIDPREYEAAKHNLNYIGMSGNIGCLVNGAGLAMATMDIIKLHGGEPANFLDVGGSVKEDQVFHAFNILTSDSSVKSILVNVFGGIVNCATIANGIVNACRNMNLNIPLVVRLEGTNVNEAKKILAESGLPIRSATNLDDAAQKAVASLIA
ncbi:hypothetical protein B566_EDAN003683 [Ephemera danica]|nr:hypothetical protein B566_EDAN003683 [Ephemera danica]